MGNNQIRDWSKLDVHYNKLTTNVALELESPHHAKAAKEVVEQFCKGLDFESVVELGCGTAPMLNQFAKMGKKTCGVTLLHEPIDHEFFRRDMHFSGLETDSFDLVASRHSLEHSPMPLLLLMEMHRIASKYALIIVPEPNQRMIATWTDHYSVFSRDVWEKLFAISGWKIVKFKQEKFLEIEEDVWDEEFRWLLRAK